MMVRLTSVRFAAVPMAALEQAPPSNNSTEISGWNELDNKNWDEAAASFLKALEQNSHASGARTGLAATAYWASYDDKYFIARQCYERLVALNPTHSKYKILLAETLMKEGDYDEALSVYEDLLNKESENVEYLTQKAECLYQLDRPDESILILKKVLRENPHLQTAQEKMKQVDPNFSMEKQPTTNFSNDDLEEYEDDLGDEFTV